MKKCFSGSYSRKGLGDAMEMVTLAPTHTNFTSKIKIVLIKLRYALMRRHKMKRIFLVFHGVAFLEQGIRVELFTLLRKYFFINISIHHRKWILEKFLAQKNFFFLIQIVIQKYWKNLKKIIKNNV